MGLAMAPATDSIMGSLPADKAGVGSAMNDTTREIGGALGVAILGSITNAIYSSSITSNPGFLTLQQTSTQLADAVQDSIGSAVVAAQTVGGSVAGAIRQAANQAFVDALSTTVIVGAIVATGGAAIAFVLPARREPPPAAVTSWWNAARGAHHPQRDRNAATSRRSPSACSPTRACRASRTNAIAARSGVSASALQESWSSRVDAVADALAEI